MKNASTHANEPPKHPRELPLPCLPITNLSPPQHPPFPHQLSFHPGFCRPLPALFAPPNPAVNHRRALAAPIPIQARRPTPSIPLREHARYAVLGTFPVHRLLPPRMHTPVTTLWNAETEEKLWRTTLHSLTSAAEPRSHPLEHGSRRPCLRSRSA